MSAYKNEKNCTVQEALDHVEVHYVNTLNEFMACRKRIRSYGSEIDGALRDYMIGIEQLVWGTIVWTSGSKRYWEDGATLQKTQTFELKRQGEGIRVI